MDAFVQRMPPAQRQRGRSDEVPLEERTVKRRKRDEVEDVSTEAEGSATETRNSAEADGCRRGSVRTTDVENALPPTQTDEVAIEEYELFQRAHLDRGGDADRGSGEERPQWIKGRSSIYVDAFNLALDTVLDEESQLFSADELEVFRQWRDLSYEAQYLYVRLFLRKTAAWHRSNRLGYYADVSDPEAAIALLQQPRCLSQGSIKPEGTSSMPGLGLEELDSQEALFTFADSSENGLSSVEEAASLLYLDELKAMAKRAKAQGRNKAELIKSLCRVSQRQAGLTTLGLGRQNSRGSNASTDSDKAESSGARGVLRGQSQSREQRLLGEILEILGPCVRLSPPSFKLFERVHLVFYRSTEWTEKSLTTIILAKTAKRNFPEYVVCRTSTIFASRNHLVEFEAAIRQEAEADGILESSGTPSESDLQRIVDMFEAVYPRWQTHVAEEHNKERGVYEMGEGAYLRRFNPAHPYTRIMVKAMYVFGRRKEYSREHGLLSELLAQKLFHLARRGGWYQRKALLEQHYMAALDEDAGAEGMDQRRKRWLQTAAATCEAGLQDPDCHLIHHHDLQKRLVRLERKLRVPRRLQHDFGHVRLTEPEEMTVEGVQLRRRHGPPRPGAAAVAPTRTVWLDELGSGGECSVEEMCLSYFRAEGWKGYHAEGGVVRTLFAYLFYDILFVFVPNVFQTAYQTCPLDLHTDAFFPTRMSEINRRLAEIANGEGERLLRGVWEREHERRTAAAGLDWDFDVEDLAELVRCFKGGALAAVCKVMAQEYKSRGGGVPDLLLWRRATDGAAGRGEDAGPGPDEDGGARPAAPMGEVMFAEVKSANDRLSDTQRLWIHVLTGAGVRVALCNAVAKEVREVG